MKLRRSRRHRLWHSTVSLNLPWRTFDILILPKQGPLSRTCWTSQLLSTTGLSQTKKFGLKRVRKKWSWTSCAAPTSSVSGWVGTTICIAIQHQDRWCWWWWGIIVVMRLFCSVAFSCSSLGFMSWKSLCSMQRIINLSKQITSSSNTVIYCNTGFKIKDVFSKPGVTKHVIFLDPNILYKNRGISLTCHTLAIGEPALVLLPAEAGAHKLKGGQCLQTNPLAAVILVHLTHRDLKVTDHPGVTPGPG